MKNKNGQTLFNSVKKEVINAKKYVAIKNWESGTMALDFMTEQYEINHIDLINFMNTNKTMELMKSKLSEKERGYVQVFVKKNGKSFETYAVNFMPYHIIHKYWGLGYKDVNIDDFVQFECLYENDNTKFRGSFSK